MPDFQSYVFARGLANSARRINGFPLENLTGGIHGHTFRFTACVPFVDASPATFEDQLKSCFLPLDFGFLNDLIDKPTDERLAKWVLSRLEPASSALGVGVNSAEPWSCTVDKDGLVLVSHAFQFDAAHWLPRVPADHQCARMHGHHFSAAITINAAEFSGNSMLLYNLIAEHWQPIQQRMQGNCLNDISGLENPTSELMAKWIWQELQDRLPGLTTVSVCETVTAGCSFDGEKFRIWKDQRFESALDNPDAPGEHKVSGRGYLLRLNLQAPLDDVAGWVHDFGDVRESFRPYMQRLDHHHLSELQNRNVSNSVELAHWLMEQLSGELPKLNRIDLFESSSSGLILVNSHQPPQLAYPLV